MLGSESGVTGSRVVLSCSEDRGCAIDRSPKEALGKGAFGPAPDDLKLGFGPWTLRRALQSPFLVHCSVRGSNLVGHEKPSASGWRPRARPHRMPTDGVRPALAPAGGPWLYRLVRPSSVRGSRGNVSGRGSLTGSHGHGLRRWAEKLPYRHLLPRLLCRAPVIIRQPPRWTLMRAVVQAPSGVRQNWFCPFGQNSCGWRIGSSRAHQGASDFIGATRSSYAPWDAVPINRGTMVFHWCCPDSYNGIGDNLDSQKYDYLS